MKGILLAGGTGTRLYPETLVISKHLLPISDKPMIYYPLSTLMLAGIRDILIIATPHEAPLYFNLLGDGSQLGISIHYEYQKEAEGIAQAFTIGDHFIGQDKVCLMLGDNLLYGHDMSKRLKRLSELESGAYVLAYPVKNPDQFGVVSFNKKNKATAIKEKPKNPDSNYAVIGLYFYDNNVVDIARQLKKSARGEYEVSDVNQHYLKKKALQVETLGRGIAWLDVGTHEALLKASKFIEVLEEQMFFKIGCIEEVAWRMGYIDQDQLLKLAHPLSNSGYGKYLLDLVEKNM